MKLAEHAYTYIQEDCILNPWKGVLQVHVCLSLLSAYYTGVLFHYDPQP